ncbi:TPA: hypothetical protein ACPV0K_004565 [Vibrio parahaemolyticus]|uniref:hypothetical protein n=2 Tax=Vibrio parahaemolyticus TaxID=670 RepID=UPI0009A84A8E|nr:hypothetical protein [Vibrio parahaemolyticus]
MLNWSFDQLHQITKDRNNMSVKHTPTGVVHSGSKGGTTGCGTDTKKNADHWVNSHEKITCDKNGCKP